MNQQDNPADIQNRLPLLVAFIIIGALFLLVRLWYLQAIRGEYYYEQAENNRIRPLKIMPPRGVIYDRKGRPLVENELVFDISMLPEDAPDMNATIEKLSSIINMSPDDIKAIIADARGRRSRYDPVKIAEEATWREVAIVEANQDDLPGTIIEPEHRRHYPYGSLAAHQLGYIGKVTETQLTEGDADIGSWTGRTGLEKVYDDYLRGAVGRHLIQVNASGRKVKELGIDEPTRGTDLYLTIDLDVQKAAEEGLGDHAGAVVAMDPNTGEIIALASHPSYDPNLFPRGISKNDWVQLSNDPAHPMYNRAIQSVYPPGSTFKIVVALAGLESGLIKPDDKVLCTGGLRSGRRMFRCWKASGHGNVSLHDALVESCDVYFYTMGDRIGWDRIAAYAKKLGLGSLTGLPLPGEQEGLIPTTAWKKKRLHESWYTGDTYINSIGQGFVLVSPIQACRMISAVANGGRFYRPMLLKKIRDRETGEEDEFSPELMEEVAIKPRNLKAVRSSLVGVVNEPHGTAHGAATPLGTVAGKTGTAQVVAQRVAGKKRPGKTEDHAWFVAYAPADNPKIAVSVIVEHGGHGGSAAAPVAKKVIEEYLKNVGPADR